MFLQRLLTAGPPPSAATPQWFRLQRRPCQRRSRSRSRTRTWSRLGTTRPGPRSLPSSPRPTARALPRDQVDSTFCPRPRLHHQLPSAVSTAAALSPSKIAIPWCKMPNVVCCNLCVLKNRRRRSGRREHGDQFLLAAAELAAGQGPPEAHFPEVGFTSREHPRAERGGVDLMTRYKAKRGTERGEAANVICPHDDVSMWG